MYMLKREHLIVSGVVQGVGFRKFIERRAKELDLRGWVRNLDDGTVEISAQGQNYALDELFRCAIKGPDRAKVVSIQKKETALDCKLERFRVLTESGTVFELNT